MRKWALPQWGCSVLSYWMTGEDPKPLQRKSFPMPFNPMGDLQHFSLELRRRGIGSSSPVSVGIFFGWLLGTYCVCQWRLLEIISCYPYRTVELDNLFSVVMLRSISWWRLRLYVLSANFPSFELLLYLALIRCIHTYHLRAVHCFVVTLDVDLNVKRVWVFVDAMCMDSMNNATSWRLRASAI